MKYASPAVGGRGRHRLEPERRLPTADGGDRASNGNSEMLASMVEHTDIEDLLAATISVDESETFA